MQYRYQLCDPLDSITMEVNANAELLTFEQYYVYGGTSFSLARSQLEAGSKELRFCGKEQDIATGLYYYGARYYAAWLCRWMSPDPAGPVDGPNLYEYVGSNPVNYNDPSGMGKPTHVKKEPKKGMGLRIDFKGISQKKKQLTKVIKYLGRLKDGTIYEDADVIPLMTSVREFAGSNRAVSIRNKNSTSGLLKEASNLYNKYNIELNKLTNDEIQAAYKASIGPLEELPDTVYLPEKNPGKKNRKYYENSFLVTKTKQQGRSNDSALLGVMNSNFDKSSSPGKQLSASDFYDRAFDDRDRTVAYAFCHLHAYIQGGPNATKNIVYASEHANWVQLALEKTVSKMAEKLDAQVKITVRAKVYLNSDGNPTRIASKLIYIIHPEVAGSEEPKAFTILGNLTASKGLVNTAVIKKYIKDNYTDNT